MIDNTKEVVDLEHQERLSRATRFAQSILSREKSIGDGNRIGSRALSAELLRRVSNGEDVSGLGNYYTSDWERISCNFDREEFLDKQLTGNVLDVGSGANSKLLALKDQTRVTYFDRQYLPNHPNAVQGDMKAMKFADHSFDSVFAGNVFFPDITGHAEYVKQLDEIKRVLVPGGTLMINCNAPEIPELLVFFETEGIKYDSENCQLDLTEDRRKHKSLGIEQTITSAYITLKL